MRWEAFQQCCLSYHITPMTIPLDVTIRWNSTYRMLERSVYLRRAIHHFIDDAETDLGAYKLNDNEWELVEVLLLFLMPFQRCTVWFESNQHEPEIDYVFFAYDTMYNHIDDVKAALTERRGVGQLECSQFMLSTLENMTETLRKYYSTTEFSPVYSDAMILNPPCKVSIQWRNLARHRCSSLYQWMSYAVFGRLFS